MHVDPAGGSRKETPPQTRERAQGARLPEAARQLLFLGPHVRGGRQPEEERLFWEEDLETDGESGTSGVSWTVNSTINRAARHAEKRAATIYEGAQVLT